MAKDTMNNKIEDTDVLDAMERVVTYQITDSQGHGVEVFKL